MEFLNHKTTLAELRPAGLVELPEDEDDGIVRLSFEPNGKAIKAAHCAAIGTALALKGVDHAENRTTIEKAETLPRLVEDLLHKHKVNEALIVPVGRWRAVCDVLAFELASDPSWQDIDAEASLHLNARDPLLLTPRDFHILPTMLGALLRSAPDDSTGGHDLSLVAAGVGMILEFRPAGAVVMTSTNPSFCAELPGMA